MYMLLLYIYIYIYIYIIVMTNERVNICWKVIATHGKNINKLENRCYQLPRKVLAFYIFCLKLCICYCYIYIYIYIYIIVMTNERVNICWKVVATHGKNINKLENRCYQLPRKVVATHGKNNNKWESRRYLW
jgi:uncharacterized Rossmann fold enzyme